MHVSFIESSSFDMLNFLKFLVFTIAFCGFEVQAQVSSVEGVTPLEGVQITRPSNATSDAQREDKYWDDVKAVGNKDAFEAYINAYPRGRYLNLAKANLSQLKANNSNVTKKNDESDLGLFIFKSILDEMIKNNE